MTTTGATSDRSQGSMVSTSKREFRAQKVDECVRPPCERTLLRVVFKDVGEPLRFAKGPKKLMCCAMDGTKGLQSLWECLGLIHQDIAPGNFLMNTLEDAPEGMRGFVIDLGLSVMVRSEKNAHFLQNLATTVHDHRTGTLPFMATQLLEDLHCEHRIHHDLEGVFWLLLCECLQAMREYHEDLVKPENLTAEAMEAMPGLVLLESLRDHNPSTVAGAKLSFLTFPQQKIRLDGRHAALQPFLIEYAKLCYQTLLAESRGEEKLLTFTKVVKLMEKTIAELPDDPPSSIVIPTSAATSESGPGPVSISGSKRSRPLPRTEAEKEESKRLKANHARRR
ncbi:hypothetical protein FRB95_014053 [Tulasnella sp. JGI-2019a]|nr:hypothetical protein FRB95_014053 [Tulasnella sp. JGI-2019a]